MALVQDWLPPTRQNWELVVYFFQFFPVITLVQWVIPWYGAGKTSGNSKLYLPGRWAWLTMEVPGFMTLLYLMNTLPAELDLAELPWQNKLLGALFVIHYIYRAIIAPLIAPSMSPIHIIVWIFAVCFQLANSISIGGWLAGYGPSTPLEWENSAVGYDVTVRLGLGLLVWTVGFLGNMYHDDELREIRRAALREQKKREAAEGGTSGKGKGKGVDKVYMIPQNGLFRWILYPHYVLEWVEWSGFWLMAGVGCVPARSFLLNEIAAMVPRALRGLPWYVKRFGKERVGNRKALIPGVL